MTTEPTYGGLTASQLWQAIAEAGAAEMSIKPLVLAALLREIKAHEDRARAVAVITDAMDALSARR